MLHFFTSVIQSAADLTVTSNPVKQAESQSAVAIIPTRKWSSGAPSLDWGLLNKWKKVIPWEIMDLLYAHTAAQSHIGYYIIGILQLFVLGNEILKAAYTFLYFIKQSHPQVHLFWGFWSYYMIFLYRWSDVHISIFFWALFLHVGVKFETESSFFALETAKQVII